MCLCKFTDIWLSSVRNYRLRCREQNASAIYTISGMVLSHDFVSLIARPLAVLNKCTFTDFLAV